MSKLMVYRMAWLILLCGFANAQAADVLRFDFEPAGTTPEPGYIHVDENTIYSAAAGYGVNDPNTATSSKWANTRNNGIGVYKDFVCMGAERDFRVDLENGNYYVTVIAGDPGYVQLTRFGVEGVVYGWTLAGGVFPEGAPLYIRQYTPWVEDLEQIEIPNSAWRDAGGGKVRVLGYNTGSYTDEDSKKCESLVLDRALVSITDGQLNIENCWDDDNLLSAVIVEAVEKQQLWFDFGPEDVAPADGFIRVPHDLVYSPFQGYGIYHHNTSFTPTPRSVQRSTTYCPYTKLCTFVDMSSGQRFQVDVPNGDYYITVVAGDPSYTYYERLYINETIYGWSYANGVTPVGAPLYILQHTGWQTDLETIDIPASSWRDAGSNNVRVLGYSAGSYTDEDSKGSEFLMLDRALVTVTDGQIRVENQWGTGNKLNYVQIIPANCADLIAGGYTLDGDFNQDCAVDLADFSILTSQWMICNNPQDNSCIKNW